MRASQLSPSGDDALVSEFGTDGCRSDDVVGLDHNRLASAASADEPPISADIHDRLFVIYKLHNKNLRCVESAS
jgi:hypothetical protein